MQTDPDPEILSAVPNQSVSPQISLPGSVSASSFILVLQSYGLNSR